MQTYFLYDELGSMTDLTDGDGDVVDATGTAVAGPAGGVGGSIAGAAIGSVGCAWVEKKIGQAAAAATYLEILNSCGAWSHRAVSLMGLSRECTA